MSILASARSSAYGINLVALESTRWDATNCLARVIDALALLSTTDPPSLRKVCNNLGTVYCFPLRPGVAGEYVHELRMCLLDPSYVLDEQTPVFLIANTIVHEAAHARIGRLGIKTSPGTHARIERICIRAELAFLSRVNANEAEYYMALRSAKRESLRGDTRLG